MTLVIADYGVGNIRSLTNAFEHLGCDVALSRDPEIILSAKRLVLPGVGSFPYCMEKLKEYELDAVIKSYIASNKPMLGICVGMQMLFDFGEEHGGAEGLGIIPGRVIHFSDYARSQGLPSPARLPHIDWSRVDFSGKAKNLSGSYYFVHSFVCVPEKPDNQFSSTHYDDIPFCSAVIHNNVMGVQFHPEKSGTLGLSLLRSFFYDQYTT